MPSETRRIFSACIQDRQTGLGLFVRRSGSEAKRKRSYAMLAGGGAMFEN